MAFVTREEKFTLLEKLETQSWASSTYSVDICVHGVYLRLYLPFQNAKKFHGELVNFMPKEWFYSSAPTSEKITEVVCLSPYDLDNNLGKLWDEDSDPSVTSKINEDTIHATQRDFAGVRWKNRNKAILVFHPNLSDGFFNSMRWLLPPMMLKANRLLMHSSCVIEDGSAFLFLGPSDAGKSTLAGHSLPRLVLGDDMNVLLKHNGTIFVEACALGQNPKFQGPVGKRFPLASMFWLHKKKLNGVEIVPLRRPEALTHFASCCMNFSEQMIPDPDNSAGFSLLADAITRAPTFTLSYNLSSCFWSSILSNPQIAFSSEHVHNGSHEARK